MSWRLTPAPQLGWWPLHRLRSLQRWCPRAANQPGDTNLPAPSLQRRVGPGEQGGGECQPAVRGARTTTPRALPLASTGAGPQSQPRRSRQPRFGLSPGEGRTSPWRMALPSPALPMLPAHLCGYVRGGPAPGRQHCRCKYSRPHRGRPVNWSLDGDEHRDGPAVVAQQAC